MRPETHYAINAEGSHIAYQVLGDGPRDLVFLPGWYSHIEQQWEEPLVIAFLERLASFSRLIMFDRRGFGLSDAVTGDAPSLEPWADDLLTVLDAAGSSRASVVATSNAAPVALFSTAAHPERVTTLVVFNGFARLTRADGYPAGIPQHLLDDQQRIRDAQWGTNPNIGLFNPSLAGNDRVREWVARYERLSASLGTAQRMRQILFTVDVRATLPLVTAPTKIIHRAGCNEYRVGHGRYLADRIDGAVFVELPGEDSAYFAGDTAGLLDEIEEFITGTRPGPPSDRMLAAVLFTDIVGSTEQASELGDRRWGSLLGEFEDACRQQITRFHGREVFVKGDEFMVTFDGPSPAVGCALAIRGATGGLGIDVRTGIHVGEVERRGQDLAGIGVHIAARVMGEAQASEVLVSRTVVDLAVGAGWDFQPRGEHTLRGVPGAWDLFAVAG